MANPFLNFLLPRQNRSTNPGTNSHGNKRDYEISSESIGTGGSGHVVKARWKKRGSMVVALKVVRKASVQDRKEYWKILNVGFARVGTHANICVGLDCFETRSHYYIAFPLLSGGELLAKLNETGKFSEEAAREVLVVILCAISFVHSHGIIHRDIKPDNFLYRRPNGTAEDLVLIDFGLAKVLDDESEMEVEGAYEVVGTPGYAGPEVFMNKGYGKKADCFGVGVIGYNILTARSPWNSRDSDALIRETNEVHKNFPEGPLRGLSHDAVDLVKTLMGVPENRPSAREALLHPWLFRKSAVDNHRPPTPVRHSPPGTGSTNGETKYMAGSMTKM